MALSNNARFYSTVGLIFAANLLFKLIHISSSSLWYDEIISAQDTLLDFGHIKHEAEWDKNPPFYHYILWIWSQCFGISELALRSMSAFFSALDAVLIYVLVRKISGALPAVLAMLVFSLHPFLFYYAQEARCYSFLMFLILCNLMAVKALTDHPGWLRALLLGVLNFLIFYTHYIAGLILFCQFLYLAYVFRKKWMYLLLIYVTPVLLVLLRFTKKQYLVLFFSNESSREKSNVPLANVGYLHQALDELYVSWIVAAIYLLALIVYTVSQVRQKQLGDQAVQFKLFVLFAPVVCIFMLYVVGIKANVFHERYLMFTLPFTIVAFFILFNHRLFLYGLPLLILALGIPRITFGESRRMDYRYAARLAKEVEKKEPVNILIQTHDVVGLFLYYYDRELFKHQNRMSKELLAKHHIFYIQNLDELKGLNLDRSRPILFFQTYQKKDDSKAIMRYFDEQRFARFTGQHYQVQYSYLKARKPV